MWPAAARAVEKNEMWPAAARAVEKNEMSMPLFILKVENTFKNYFINLQQSYKNRALAINNIDLLVSSRYK